MDQKFVSVITEKLGVNPTFDKLFEDLRQQQEKSSHRFANNYETSNFDNVLAYTIAFNIFGEPEICSTISRRPCWPYKTYRILNRTWKCTNKLEISKEISQPMGAATISQIQWLTINTDCKFYFISRQTNNWMKWVSEHYKKQFYLDFKISERKYLTCCNTNLDDCWQYIIYNGDDKMLTMWKSKC